MKEKEAKKVLYRMWENGEIPDSFNENHSDYHKAIEYIKERGNFDYDEFNSEKSIIKFGIWQVEKDALVGKISYDYIINSSRLWETSNYNGYLVWDWLIHLAQKANISPEDIKDLNTAFFFCQVYFRDQKPVNLPYVSTSKTLIIQKQNLDLRLKKI